MDFHFIFSFHISYIYQLILKKITVLTGAYQSAHEPIDWFMRLIQIAGLCIFGRPYNKHMYLHL